MSSSTATASSVATGASLTGLTVSETVARLESTTASRARKVNESGPLWFAAGVYVRVAPDPESTPCNGASTIAKVSGSPSASVAIRLTTTAVSSSVAAVPSLATGGWLTDSVAQVTLASAERPAAAAAISAIPDAFEVRQYGAVPSCVVTKESWTLTTPTTVKSTRIPPSPTPL